MSVRKSLCALAVTIAVIVGMAFLPFVLGGVEERRTQGEPCYVEISPIELKMDNGTIQQLLLLSSVYNSHEIDEEQAMLSLDEVKTFVSEGLKPYLESGLLPFAEDFVVDFEGTRPCLAYDAKSDGAGGSVFWMVVLDVVDGGTVELILDDNTGKILVLICSTKAYFDKLSCSPAEALHLYMNTYLDALGIEDLEKELLDYNQSGSIHHAAVMLQHPDLSGYLLISFMADEWGLNMQIQSEVYGNVMYDK